MELMGPGFKAPAGNVKRHLVAFGLGCILMMTGALTARAAQWDYVRSGERARGTLSVSKRDGGDYVSVRQFCFALSCRAFYQWANQRAVIENTSEHLGAIISPLTHIALANGEILDFDRSVVSDPREGYLIPIQLASELATRLALGKIIRSDPDDEPVERHNASFELKTLVIDPGHGGNDFGTGFGDIYEKDISLIYAMKLRDELKKAMPELNVLLTRTDDRYVSLPDRARFANSNNANLFLSLHVNHAPDVKAEGVESYILSPDATDDQAKKLALLENDTWLKNAKINDAGTDIRKILIDMEQEKYIQHSARAAAIIQQELGHLDKTRGLKSRGVKQAMFYVLSQVAMPSTLVEIGFLSNTGDRSRLMDVEFRDDFVQSLVTALKRYAEQTSRK